METVFGIELSEGSIARLISCLLVAFYFVASIAILNKCVWHTGADPGY